MKEKEKAPPYTCNEYRQEMILVSLKKKLQQADLGEEERSRLLQDIKKLEEEMGM